MDEVGRRPGAARRGGIRVGFAALIVLGGCASAPPTVTTTAVAVTPTASVLTASPNAASPSATYTVTRPSRHGATWGPVAGRGPDSPECASARTAVDVFTQLRPNAVGGLLLHGDIDPRLAQPDLAAYPADAAPRLAEMRFIAHLFIGKKPAEAAAIADRYDTALTDLRSAADSACS